MRLPFTIDQFLRGFHSYNDAVWPMQWFLNALAIVAVVAAIRGGRRASVAAVAILSVLWVWVGIVYPSAFLGTTNRAAVIMGIPFIIQGILIARLGFSGASRLRYERHFDGTSMIGLALVAYALIVYPVLGYMLGHRYPSAPTFGVPCPTTIFTFGMLLLAALPRARALIVIPIGWTIFATSAVWQLGMWEDLGLPVAAILAAIILLFRKPSDRGTAVALARA
jgi:hypothetical protein